MTLPSFNAFYRDLASLLAGCVSEECPGPKQLWAIKLLANTSAVCLALTTAKPDVDARDPHILDHTTRDPVTRRHIRAWGELEDGKYGRAMHALNATAPVDLSSTTVQTALHSLYPAATITPRHPPRCTASR